MAFVHDDSSLIGTKLGFEIEGGKYNFLDRGKYNFSWTYFLKS